jgi:hypothetical protein
MALAQAAVDAVAGGAGGTGERVAQLLLADVISAPELPPLGSGFRTTCNMWEGGRPAAVAE